MRGSGRHARRCWSLVNYTTTLKFAPDIVLVQVSADAEVIARRMKDTPHPNTRLKRDDIKAVVDAFERSTIRH